MSPFLFDSRISQMPLGFLALPLVTTVCNLSNQGERKDHTNLILQ